MTASQEREPLLFSEKTINELESPIKRVGHAFSIEGELEFLFNQNGSQGSKVFNYESSEPIPRLLQLRDALLRFKNLVTPESKKLVVIKTINLLEISVRILMNSNSPDKVKKLVEDALDRYGMVLIFSGWDNHGTAIVITNSPDKNFYFCNKGMGYSGYGVEVFTIKAKREKWLNDEMVSFVNLNSEMSFTQYMSLRDKHFELQAETTEWIKTSEQKSGNCGYASAKLAFLPIFINLFSPTEQEQAKALYKSFSHFAKVYALAHLVRKIDEANLENHNLMDIFVDIVLAQNNPNKEIDKFICSLILMHIKEKYKGEIDFFNVINVACSTIEDENRSILKEIKKFVDESQNYCNAIKDCLTEKQSRVVVEAYKQTPKKSKQNNPDIPPPNRVRRRLSFSN